MSFYHAASLINCYRLGNVCDNLVHPTSNQSTTVHTLAYHVTKASNSSAHCPSPSLRPYQARPLSQQRQHKITMEMYLSFLLQCSAAKAGTINEKNLLLKTNKRFASEEEYKDQKLCLLGPEGQRQEYASRLVQCRDILMGPPIHELGQPRQVLLALKKKWRVGLGDRVYIAMPRLERGDDLPLILRQRACLIVTPFSTCETLLRVW
jgi:hypothetical protein